jgi:hypothetical protein
MHHGFSGDRVGRALMPRYVHPSCGGGAAISMAGSSRPRAGSGFSITLSLLVRGVRGSSDGMNVHHGDGA